MENKIILKLEKILFYFFLFCFPLQTRILLWGWGDGFIEWNSAFLYLTDLFITAIIFFWALRKKFWIFGFSIFREIKKSDLFLIVFFLLSGVSLIKAGNLSLGIYQQLKLFEFLILFFYLKNNFSKIFNLDCALKILFFSAIFQVILGIGQFSLQRDFGLKIFGESPLGPNIDGVAKITISGVKMIRAYGTFPHPNILAAFLIFALFGFYVMFLRSKRDSFGKNLAWMSAFFIVVFGLFLTFSRIAILSFSLFSLLIFLFLFFKKGFYGFFRRRSFMLAAFFIISVIVCLVFMQKEFYSRFVKDALDPGINLRFFYNFISLSIVKENPFLGVGEGNFVWNLKNHQGTLRAANLIYKIDAPETEITPYKVPDWLYQPVHNIYLLIASENGIFAVLIFAVFLYLILWPVINALKADNIFFIFYFLFFAFCIISLTDHFFWTLQQGRLMFWILAGFLAGFSGK